jgi:hypothetical protein
MKQNQIFCENVHVIYNKMKIGKQIEKIKSELNVHLEEKLNEGFQKFLKDIDNLNNYVLIQEND